MDADMLKEIEACIAGLTDGQKKAIAEVFVGKLAKPTDEDEEEEPTKKPKSGLEKTQGFFKCNVIQVCTLCGTEHVTVMQSSSRLPSTMRIPTCGSCKAVLIVMDINEVADRAIKAADGAYTAVKEATNALVPLELGCAMPERIVKQEGM